MRFLVHLAALAVTIGHVVWGQCIVPITKLPVDSPVFFKNGDYMPIIGGNFVWAAGEETAVSCAEYKFQSFPTQNLATVKCIKDTLFLVNGINVDITKLSCTLKFRGRAIKGGKCANNAGTLIHFGFDGDKGFRTFYTSCYNENTLSAIYTEHILLGSVIKYVEPIVRTGEFMSQLTKFTYDTFYTQLSTGQVFEKVLGLNQQKTIKSVSFLARGHLTPNADGMMAYFMRSTFFYENAVPQWQSINAGNWLAIENLGRAVAKKLERDLRIFSGVHEVLALPDTMGTEHKIYLKEPYVEVPKWTWKIIKDETTNSAIALVTFNNPFRAPTAAEVLCTKNICGTTGWDKPNFVVPKSGFTYCCSVADLMNKVKTVPLAANAANVLAFP